MTEGLKWTVNHVARSDDKHLELMSEENVKKANEFHKSFPQYTVTPLQDLAELASYLGVKSIHCKDESDRKRTSQNSSHQLISRKTSSA